MKRHLTYQTARILTIACVLFFFASCRVQYVPVDHIRTEYVHDTIQRVDSVWRDRWHTEVTKGDTVYIRDSITDYKYKTVDRIVEKSVTDSVDRPIPMPAEWTDTERFMYKSGIALWVIIGLILLAVIGGLFIKFAK